MRKRAARFLLAFAAIVVLAAGGYAYWFRGAALASLPQLDGSITAKGLSAPVHVIRDQHGVPHVTAANLDDLFFAQGFVTAQDRLWQMDINRRFGRGELSEVLGERALLLDKRQRILQMRRTAERAAAMLPPRARQHLEAYARGVNALIQLQISKLPIEFRVLRYQPRPWTLEDSLIIGLNIAQNLSTQFDLEQERELLIARLTPEQAADLYPNRSWRDRPPMLPPASGQLAVVEPPAASATPNVNDVLRLPPAPASICDDCAAGSNNWVVSGARTASGKPLLSNDMHLQHSIPNVWYETHLTSGDFDVAGVSFPGLPWIVAGHNRRIAWGYTNLGPDVQDLFIENFNGNGEYETPQGWKKAETVREEIKVKGGKDVTIDVQITRHGPVVSDIFENETRKLALQWTVYDPRTVALTFFDMNAAQDWQQFLAAIKSFGGATQNVVYADVDGNIGYHAAGWIPTRAAGDGLVPVPGNTDQYSWTGYVPFEQLPQVFNPPSGVIATANGRVVPDNYPYLLANQWSAPYRTERIYRVLESRTRVTADDMLQLQMDTYSEFDRLLANALVYAIDHAPAASERARKAADLMRGWNGRIDADSPAAAIAVRTRRQLWRLLLEPKLGADWEKYKWFGSSTAMERLLRLKPARWVPPSFTGWGPMLAAAVELAIKDAPRDLSTWRYGSEYPVRVNHPIFAGFPILNRYSGPGTHPQSGNGLTVKAAGAAFGASQRMTVDLANLDASRLNIVAGQSGQLFSPHYLDHWPAWYGGSTFTLPFSPAQVSEQAKHRLELLP